MLLGQKIKALRKQRRLSQLELADLAGMPQATYSRLESKGDDISFLYLKSIAKALGLSVLDLITYGEESVKETIASENVSVYKPTKATIFLRHERSFRYKPEYVNDYLFNIGPIDFPVIPKQGDAMYLDDFLHLDSNIPDDEDVIHIITGQHWFVELVSWGMDKENNIRVSIFCKLEFL